jgi:saccharopine dehydrogenase (NAD+, L-glutamate forming)
LGFVNIADNYMIPRITLFGAGKSASHFILHFYQKALKGQCSLHILDGNLDNVKKLIEPFDSVFLTEMNLSLTENYPTIISESDIVVSLLPPVFHVPIAKICVELKKNLVTASYVSEEMNQLDKEAKEASIILMNECGADPGLDHLSAIKLFREIESKGGIITGFSSSTGGLIADASDNNPWKYKFTWNPRNVVLAGSAGTAMFFEGDEIKLTPYHRLFGVAEEMDLGANGVFESYANRNSLPYKSLYQLHHVKSLKRGTLRKKGFCAAWNVLVQLGYTDDVVKIKRYDSKTWRQLTSNFVSGYTINDLEEALLTNPSFQCNKEALEKIQWLGLLDDAALPEFEEASPAYLLQCLLESKWKLETNDKDLLVMAHQIIYEMHGKSFELKSNLVLEGEDAVFTAMSKTVGLTAAWVTEAILEGIFKLPGVQIPTDYQLATFVLNALATQGITFDESVKEC